MSYKELKYTAQECIDIRGMPPHWYDFDTLAITYGIGHTDAMFIAAASPDAILRLIAERDALREALEYVSDECPDDVEHEEEVAVLVMLSNVEIKALREALAAVHTIEI